MLEDKGVASLDSPGDGEIDESGPCAHEGGLGKGLSGKRKLDGWERIEGEGGGVLV